MARPLGTWVLLAAGAAALACSSGPERTAPAPTSSSGQAAEATPAADPVAAVPPAPDDCADAGKSGSERVRCKFELLADAGAATADALYASSVSGLLSPGQRKTVVSARDRIQREKVRAVDRLRTLTRKRDSACQLAECDGTVYPACAVGNRDGLCDAGEDCLEAIGDGIGDDRQPCSPKKGRHAEDCVVVCDDEAVCRDDANLDPDLEANLEGELDEAIGHARAMKGALDRSGPVAAAAVAALSAGAPGDDLCVLDAHGLQRTSDLLGISLKVAAVSTRGIADIAERACDTTAFGFNCAACCVVLEAIAGVAAVANDLAEVTDDIVNSATLDAALACVDQVNAKTSQSLADVKLLQEGLERVEATQAEIVRLLLTPPGLRPEYPQP